MTDIFISYSSEDRERARTVASALQRRGWSVWWDRDIKAGQAFDQAIDRTRDGEERYVLWSKNPIASEWVKGEAAAAVQRGVLVPALIDNVKLPLEFSRRQTADLIGWEGDTSHAGFQALCDGMAGTAGMAPAVHIGRFRESASGTRLLESKVGIKGLVADTPRPLDGVGNLPCRPCGSCRRAESSSGLPKRSSRQRLSQVKALNHQEASDHKPANQRMLLPPLLHPPTGTSPRNSFQMRLGVWALARTSLITMPSMPGLELSR